MVSRIRRRFEVSAQEAGRRAVEDYSQYSQHVRTAAQFVFAANGGAAAAILSFLTAVITREGENSPVDVGPVIQGFSISAAIFLFGVLLSSVSLYVMSIAKQNWGNFWEDIAVGGMLDFDSYWAKQGDLFGKIGSRAIVLAIVAFCSGSVFAVRPFF